LLFTHQLKKKQVVLVEDLKEIPTIKADADQLQQVFSNLILNAIDAMPNGGTLSIKTHQNGNQIVAEIADSGVGIPEANLKNIFDPFFTTKSKGNGLGLAVSFKIIEEHNAAIEVESVTGKGTTFRIKFIMKS
jgi:signal transduction histidine kinase